MRVLRIRRPSYAYVTSGGDIPEALVPFGNLSPRPTGGSKARDVAARSKKSRWRWFCVRAFGQ